MEKTQKNVLAFFSASLEVWRSYWPDMGQDSFGNDGLSTQLGPFLVSPKTPRHGKVRALLQCLEMKVYSVWPALRRNKQVQEGQGAVGDIRLRSAAEASSVPTSCLPC